MDEGDCWADAVDWEVFEAQGSLFLQVLCYDGGGLSQRVFIINTYCFD